MCLSVIIIIATMKLWIMRNIWFQLINVSDAHIVFLLSCFLFRARFWIKYSLSKSSEILSYQLAENENRIAKKFSKQHVCIILEPCIAYNPVPVCIFVYLLSSKVREMKINIFISERAKIPKGLIPRSLLREPIGSRACPGVLTPFYL